MLNVRPPAALLRSHANVLHVMLFALNLQWSELNRVLVSKYKQKTVLLLWAMSCNSIFELNTCSLAAGDVGQSNIIGSFVETHHFFSAAFCLCLSVSSWTTSKSYWPVANHFCCSNSMLEAETVKCSALNLKCHWHHTVHFFFFLLFRVLKNFWHHRVCINHDHTQKIS